MSHTNVLEQIESIAAAATFKRACAIYEGCIQPRGAQYYTCGPIGAAPSNAIFAVAEAPRGWFTHYVKSGMVKNDPAVRRARDGATFLWSEVEPEDAKEAEVLADVLQNSGMSEGFVTVTPGPGTIKAGISIAGTGIAGWTARERLEAKLLGQALMERAMVLNALQVKARLPILSRSEKIMLTSASNGHVDKEIAQELGIAPGRVHERWRQLRRKLDAKDRANAVSVAVAVGLVPPPSRAMQIINNSDDPEE